MTLMYAQGVIHCQSLECRLTDSFQFGAGQQLRALLLQAADDILADADHQDVAFLVVGDPFG